MLVMSRIKLIDCINTMLFVCFEPEPACTNTRCDSSYRSRKVNPNQQRKIGDETVKITSDPEAYNLQKGVIKKFCRSKVVVQGLDDLIDADMANMQGVSKYNNRVRFMMVVIDDFAR